MLECATGITFNRAAPTLNSTTIQLMHYGLFISYSRRDNSDGRISKLIERIEADFRSFANRPLTVWVDVDQIRVMHDWRRQLSDAM